MGWPKLTHERRQGIWKTGLYGSLLTLAALGFVGRLQSDGENHLAVLLGYSGAVATIVLAITGLIGSVLTRVGYEDRWFSRFSLAALLVMAPIYGVMIAQHAKSQLKMKWSYDEANEMVVFKGPISKGFATGLMRAANGRRVSRLGITSDGGLVSEATTAMWVLKELGASRVRPLGACDSACAVLWATADHRELTAASNLGFHSVSNGIGRQDVVVAVDGSYLIGELMSWRGAKPAFVQRVLDTPGREMWRPTRAELEEGGLTFIDVQ